MVTCRLMGGLGNTLFQVANTISLAADNNSNAIFTCHMYKGNIQTHKKYDGTIISKRDEPTFYADSIFRKLQWTDDISFIEHIYTESAFTYSQIPYKPNTQLHGHFQSEKYFNHNRELILDTFDIPTHVNILIQKKYENILQGNTVSIHIRRGDYVHISDRHPVQSIDYYKKASEHFTDKEYTFLVFSDDIEWCKENLSSDFVFVDGNTDYVDLYLMSLCDHNIIANSSFSWWGAWLNKNNNKKIVAPSNWFGPSKGIDTKDLIPTYWEVI